MKFTEVDITKFQTTPKFRISRGGLMRLNKYALTLLGEKPGTENYAHFLKDSNGNYWVYLDNKPKNGLKVRIQEKGGSRDGIIQNRALVKQFIEELDLAIGEDKKSLIRLDIDPIGQPVPDTKAKSFRIY